VNKPNAIESVEPSPRASWKVKTWLAVTAALAVVSDYLLRHNADWSPSTRAIIALIPLVPCLLYVRGWIHVVRGLDELQRRIQIESRLAALLGTLFVITTINVLNTYGIAIPIFRHGFNLMETLILTFAFWKVASAVINRRYQ
jgi:hypothetical protein